MLFRKFGGVAALVGGLTLGGCSPKEVQLATHQVCGYVAAVGAIARIADLMFPGVGLAAAATAHAVGATICEAADRFRAHAAIGPTARVDGSHVVVEVKGIQVRLNGQYTR